MTNLISPANNQPCEFVAVMRGHVSLRLTCTVTPAIQWFSLAAIEAANPVHTCERDPRLTDLVYTCQEPPQPLTVVLTPEMAANVNHVIGVDILVRKPVVVSLYAPGMVA